MPTLWREALSATVPAKERAAFVEAIVRRTLAGLEPGTVLSTAELVERLFPVASVQSPEDTGARSELFARVGKLGANTTLAVKSAPRQGTGYNRHRMVQPLLWRRLENVAAVPGASAPCLADEIAAIQVRLREVEAGLSALGQSIAAFHASVTTRE